MSEDLVGRYIDYQKISYFVMYRWSRLFDAHIEKIEKIAVYVSSNYAKSKQMQMHE